MLVSAIQEPLPAGCVWAWNHVHCFSISVSCHPVFVPRTYFLYWFTSLPPSRSDCSFLTSCSTPSYFTGCHYLGESPTTTSRGRYCKAPHRSLFKEGFGLSSICFGLDLNLSPAHARQGPPLGYIPKLRKLGRSSEESMGVGVGHWSLFHATFSQMEYRWIAPVSCCQLQLPFSPQVCIPGADHMLNTILLTVLTACH